MRPFIRRGARLLFIIQVLIMTANFERLLQDVKSDRKSGAWVVAQKTIDCLEALIREKSAASVDDLVGEIARVAREVLASQPGMAQLANLFNQLFVTIESESSGDAIVLSRRVSGEAKRFSEHSKNAVAKVSELGAELINPDAIILVHSNSSTVFEIIKRAHGAGKSFEVIVTESRPVNEGRSCALELSRLGIPSIYIIDAAVSKGVEQADIVLLGSDSLSEKYIVNKIGSTAISLLAREAVVPCYAVGESSKFTPQKLKPKKEQPRDPGEVWKSPPENTRIESYYFDDVPLDFFTGIVTEEGILTPEEIGGRIRAQKMSTKLIEMLK
jgi:translation initiation factor eIF-2B subunit delta